MRIDHIHFYVDDAVVSRNWFIQMLRFHACGHRTSQDAQTEIIRSGNINFVLSSPIGSQGEVAHYLSQHPPGVADIAFTVPDLAAALRRVLLAGGKLLHPIQSDIQASGSLQWAQISAWGDVRHTLIERSGDPTLLPNMTPAATRAPKGHDPQLEPPFSDIDHIVLNLERGSLHRAINWYQRALGFEPQQSFTIQTEYSGLDSQVLVHSEGAIQFPINQPASSTSQIQEFLDINRGAGIQHIALKTPHLLQVIPELRQAGLSFLPITHGYYTHLQQTLPHLLSAPDIQQLESCQVLVDQQSNHIPALLLQIFTQPIFRQPTFFLELIERQSYYREGQRHQVEGFGARNFQALFEAIEQEQRQRASLRLQ